MKFLISEKLSQHKYKTPEGYLVCVDAILARTGKQQYRRSEVFVDGDDEIIEVDRLPEEVFSPATLASFENKPITVEHPDEDVNSENYKEYSVGFVRDVHRGVVDGVEVILGTLVITDAQTIEEIENGEHTDLSCGYDCDIQDETNPQQRNIRGNHVALCAEGRAGNARIVDSKSISDSYYKTITEVKPGDFGIFSDAPTAWYYEVISVKSLNNNQYAITANKMTKDKKKLSFSPEQFVVKGNSRVLISDSKKVKDIHVNRISEYKNNMSKYETELKNLKEKYSEIDSKIYRTEQYLQSLLKETYRYGEAKSTNDKINNLKNEISKLENDRDELNKKIIVLESDLNDVKQIKDEISLTNRQIQDLKTYSKHYNYDWQEIMDGLNSRIKREHMTIVEAIEDIKESMIENKSLYDSKCKDVNPREGETKEEFISRFMSETKEEYPDEKQRFAVANSYWEKKDMKDDLKTEYHLKYYNGKWYYEETRSDGYTKLVGPYSSAEETRTWFAKHHLKEDLLEDSSCKDSKYEFDISQFDAEELENDASRYNLNSIKLGRIIRVEGNKENISKLLKEYNMDEEIKNIVDNSCKDVKDEKTIKVTLNGKTYNAIYYGKSSSYPNMADVYIDELVNYYTTEKTPKDDLGFTPKDGKYYIRMDRLKKENPNVVLDSCVKDSYYIVACEEGDYWFDENGKPNTFEKAKRYKSYEEADRWRKSRGQGSVQKIGDSMKDAVLTPADKKMIDDVISTVKIKTLANVLDALNEQIPGFVGSYGQCVIEYINSKGIKDSKMKDQLTYELIENENEAKMFAQKVKGKYTPYETNDKSFKGFIVWYDIKNVKDSKMKDSYVIATPDESKYLSYQDHWVDKNSPDVMKFDSEWYARNIARGERGLTNFKIVKLNDSKMFEIKWKDGKDNYKSTLNAKTFNDAISKFTNGLKSRGIGIYGIGIKSIKMNDSIVEIEETLKELVNKDIDSHLAALKFVKLTKNSKK